MGYVPLKVDLDHLIMGFGANAMRSIWQRKNYPEYIDREKIISHGMFGKTSFNDKVPLMLPKEDGYDGNPVGSQGYRTALNYWVESEAHTFPAAIDLVRIGFFFHTEIFATMLLAVKGEFESHLATSRGFKQNMGVAYSKFIPGDEPSEDELRTFNPDISGMVNLIEDHYHMVVCAPETPLVKQERCRLESLGYADLNLLGAKAFETLINEMIMERLHLKAITSPLFVDFSKRKKIEIGELKKGDDRQRHDFWIAKNIWIELLEELGDALMRLEAIRLRNAHIEKDFLKQFGYLYVELRELKGKMITLERLIQLKENSSDHLSRQEIEKMDQTFSQRQEKTLENLKYKFSVASNLDELEPGHIIDEKEFIRLKQEIKKALRELFMLLYPERLAQNPAFNKFTKQQKDHLNSLWHKLMAVKDEKELMFKEGMVHREMPTLEKLLDIKTTAKVLLDNAGLDVNPEYIIQGDTLRERIAWLNQEIERLRNDQKNIIDEAALIKNDAVIAEYRAVIGCPEKHDEFRKKMAESIEEHQQRAKELSDHYDSLFI